MAVLTASEAGGENAIAFLDLIGWSEGTTTNPATQNDGYDVIVTGDDHKFNIFVEYDTHPFMDGRSPVVLRHDADGKPTLKSDASGRYQIMLKSWRDYLPILHLPDFSPRSQDLFAIRQMKERGAFRFFNTGEIASAIHACSNIWASFPGNNYGQGGKPLDVLLTKFAALKGVS